MIDFDEEDFLAMQFVLTTAAFGWRSIIANLRANVGDDFADFLNKEFNPNADARDAASLLLLFAVMADVAEAKFSDCFLSIAGVLLYLACYNIS